jgi:hypothetical protein
MIENPWFYAAAIPSILVWGIAKGGFAGGLGILAVPMMSLTLPPSQVAGIMLPILCVMDLGSVWAYRKTWDGRNLLILMPSAILGNALGALTFAWLNDAAIQLMVGAIAVAFTLYYWLSRGEQRPPRPRSPWKGTFWGTVSGATSFVSHAGGPPLAVYLLPQKLDKTVYVGTTAIYFTWVNYAKLVPYYYLGQLSVGNMTTALALSPLAPLGVALGLWLHGRVNARLFYRIIYGLTFVSGVKLVYDGLAGLARLLPG